MSNEYVADENVNVRLPNSLREDALKRVEERPDLYGNLSHFIRVAMLRELKREG